MLPTTVVLGDDESHLLARARAGDTHALSQLYAAHRESSRHLAAILVGDDDADDLLEEAFVRVVARLRKGEGPRDNFRAYVASAIRNLHRDQRRRRWREEPSSDQPWLLEDPVEERADPPEEYDDARAAAALATLPAAWRQVVRLVEVDRCSIHDTADRLGLKPAAVSSLAYRAREGLRVAYLDQFVTDVPACNPECSRARPRLSRYVRGSLGPTSTCQVADHVSACAACASIVRDLQRVNSCFQSS